MSLARFIQKMAFESLGGGILRYYKDLPIVANDVHFMDEQLPILCSSIDMIEKFDPLRFARLCKYTRLIHLRPNHLTAASDEVGLIHLNMSMLRPYGVDAVPVLASLIIHETTHLMLRKRLRRHPGKCLGTWSEKVCLTEELRFCKNIPHPLEQYLQNRAYYLSYYENVGRVKGVWNEITRMFMTFKT